MKRKIGCNECGWIGLVENHECGASNCGSVDLTIISEEKESGEMKHCTKCGGYGYLSGYSHVKGGTCFRCGGKRTITDKEIQEEKARNKERNRLEKIRETYPEKIAHQKKLLADVENNDAPFESEEQKEVVMAYIGRCKKRIADMEQELAEAEGNLVKQ